MQEASYSASLGGEDPLEKEMAPPPVFLPGEFHRQRSLEGYSPWGCKSRTQLSNKTTNLYQGILQGTFVSGVGMFWGLCVNVSV